MNLHVSLCQNDSNGDITDQVMMIKIEAHGELVATFETIDLMPRTVKTNDRLIQLDNGTVKYSGRSMWTGNMHWNMYSVPDYYALGLIRLLQLSKEWTCTEAWETVFEKFGKGETITGFDIDLSEGLAANSLKQEPNRNIQTMTWYPSRPKKEVQQTAKFKFDSCLHCSRPFKEEDKRFDSAAFVNAICTMCHKVFNKWKA